MPRLDFKRIIYIDPEANLPKYLQVSNGVIRAIELNKLRKGDQLPSLRKLSEELDISFDTAKKAYDVLKKRNIVVAAHGKSNVVNTTGPLPEYRIFLLFNKLGSHKRIIYDSFTQAFTGHAEIDLHVYNNNLHLFRHLLETKNPGYTHYVIIPHLADDPVEMKSIIDQYLAGENLVLLGKEITGIATPHATVHEDFANDIYSSLKKAEERLDKYQVLKLIVPENSYYPPEIMKGFMRFAEDYGYESEVTAIAPSSVLKKGDVLITLNDEDLATVIHLAQSQELTIGRDLGIISYNETPLKEVLLNGITTISTDFRMMGKLAAEQVMNHSHRHIHVPFRLTLRSSL